MSSRNGQGSLFERLDAEAPAPRSLRGRRDTASQLNGVKRQLESLLNSRQGGSTSSPDFGLPDFNDAIAGSADLLLRIAGGIRDAIEMHEPRLQVRDVRFMPAADSPLELNFRVDCALRVDSRSEAVEIDLLMNAHNRHYRVM